MKTIINSIAELCEWRKSVKPDYEALCESRIMELQERLPHGSGFDRGCEIKIANSGKKQVEIEFGYHNMNENGSYDGWTEYLLVATPAFGDADIKFCCISGVDHFDGDYSYFYDCFDCLYHAG